VTAKPVNTITIDAAALAEACDGFDRADPARSAKQTATRAQIIAGVMLLASLIAALVLAPAPTAQALRATAYALFTAAIALRLVAAASLKPPPSRLAAPSARPIYSVLCPIYREANVVADLVAALDAFDYPRDALDVKLLVEADDPDTVTAAQHASTGKPHIEIVIVPPAQPRTKPKALQAGLARARGEFVTIYDAEDRPHPDQLRAALAAFQDGPAHLACVQAPLVVDNGARAWIARQFAAEYAILFNEILPLLSRLRLPFPLGGTSNHFRTAAVRAVGGWDPYNVTEDADLGYRLARAGYAMGVITPPTWEEAPVTFKAWLAQRTRWIKGHLQTWLVLMRDPAKALREMGLGGFLAMQLVLGGGIAAAFVHAPLALLLIVAMVSPAQVLGDADLALALFGYCSAMFAALSATALSGNYSHLRAAFTMPLYWPLATIAAWRALYGLIVRPHFWAKTAHGQSTRDTPRARLKLREQ
jgi:cellulose synthase/poly-beta-1,6-N-acetylglucosamine synthase-like glycosyltransferase